MISAWTMWGFDESQLKNFTTFGALVPVVIGLIIFKFAVSAVVRSMVIIVALILGGVIFSQRAQISACIDSAKSNTDLLNGTVQCQILGFDIDVDLQDQLP